MKKRVQLNITWTFKLDQFAGAWHQVEDFQDRARQALNDRFRHYNSEISFAVISGPKPGAMTDPVVMDVQWSVDLDMVPGAWHQPEDHARLAQIELVQNMPSYAISADVAIQHLN